MQCYYKTFSQLTTQELFQIYQARTAVFVVEQQCPYQEVDAIDLEATHLWLAVNHKLVAYARIYLQHQAIHFGRVLVIPEYRHQGIAKQLLDQILHFISNTFPNKPIVIQAQHYLQAFYQQYGFIVTSEVYLEDNIPHIDMCKNN